MEEKNGRKTEETGRTENTGTNTGTPSAGTSASRAKTGASAGTSGGTSSAGTPSTENKQNEKIPQVVTVNVPEEKPKKKRTVKKKTQPKKEESGLSSAMVSDLIVGCSQVVAAKPENAHWSIDKKEADQIAVPLVKVIEKNENLKKVAEHSDTVALVMACVMVFAPRAYISMNMAKEKKARKKHAVVNEVKHNDRETEKIERGSGKDNRGHADAGTNVSPSISELLSVPI